MIVDRGVRSRFFILSLDKVNTNISHMIVFPVWKTQDFTDEFQMGFNLFFGGDPIF